MNFEELNIKPEIVKALSEMEIVTPTMIQEGAIPLAKEGKDIVGMSKTGSGKTLAFGAPILEKIEPGKGIQALIMAPTRELAVQIAREMQKFSKYLKCYITTIYGGVAIDPQIYEMAEADIVVGTPGRLLDHLQRGNLNLSKTRMVVLDEADKMAEMGFIEDVRKILSQTPGDRQVLLFGATISDEIYYLKQDYMKNPVEVKAEKHVKKDFLKQYYYNVKLHEKFSLLVHLLKKEKTERVMIFCSTRSTVEIVTDNLRANGIEAEMIHGKLTQNRREKVMDNFKIGKPKVLVASAVAARGLDIKFVSHIINYDLSQDPQEYVHRVGRTARAGEAGKAITLLSQNDFGTFSHILDKYSHIEVEELPKEDFPLLKFNVRRSGGFNGRGGGGFRGRGSGGHGGRGHGGGGHRPRRNYGR